MRIDFYNNDGGGGGEPILQQLQVTENGKYTPDAGVDGFDEVTVEVEPNVVDKNETISENGTYIYDAPQEGFDGYARVDITVDVPSISTMELTQAEYDALAEKDENIIYLITD